MKTKQLLLTVSTGLLFLTAKVNYGQDLTSINVGATLPTFTFNSSTDVLSVQLSVRNIGFFDATAFDVPLFIKNTATTTEYEIDRVNYAGLTFNQLNNGNTIQITNWTVDLNTQASVPSGTYRVIVKINDNHNATESNYTNNNEYFGNTSFVYTKVVGLKELSEDKNTSVFPNPSTGLITVESTINKISTVQITNIVGEIVDELKIDSNKKTIDLSHLSSGIYYLSLIQDSKQISVKKIIVNK